MMPGSTDLTENSKKREQRISLRYGDQQVREVYIDFFYLGGQAYGRKTESGKCPRWAQHTWARQASLARPGVLCPPGYTS